MLCNNNCANREDYASVGKQRCRSLEHDTEEARHLHRLQSERVVEALAVTGLGCIWDIY